MANETRTEMIYTRVEKRLKAEIVRLAKLDDRTMGHVTYVAVKQFVNRRLAAERRKGKS